MSTIPVLDSRIDALTCDYPDGSYQCKMTPTTGGTVKADHTLNEAPELERLLNEHAARFVVEIVSKRTFKSRLEQADPCGWSHQFNLDTAAITKRGAYARPGLIAVRDCELSTEHLAPAWRSVGSVSVRAGQWLARTQHSDMESPLVSLLRFKTDETVRRHELRCRYVDPYYDILLHPATHTECAANETRPAAKTIMLAAWVAALSDAGTRPAFTGTDTDPEPEDHMGYQLKAKLKDLDAACPAPGEDDYDPLRAATILLAADLITFDDGDN